LAINTPPLTLMKLSLQMTDEAVLKEVGQRLAGVRLARNWTQSELAEKAGLGLRTVQRMELGAVATQLTGLVRICRALGLMDRLEVLFPEPVASPMAQLKLQGKQRQRATGGKAAAAPSTAWKWGDQA